MCQARPGTEEIAANAGRKPSQVNRRPPNEAINVNSIEVGGDTGQRDNHGTLAAAVDALAAKSTDSGHKVV